MINGVEIPKRFEKLTLNEKGYPVPWFVAFIDGKPDFRVVGPGKFVDAIKRRLCWLCGESLGSYMAFVIGPMCAVNRTTSEPPSHKECAVFAARVCPFLTQLKREYRTDNLPEGHKPPAGIPIIRNPGVACVWITKSYEVFNAGNGPLIEIGEPVDVLWYREGRSASRDEVSTSISTGLHRLIELANEEGSEAVKMLNAKLETAMKLLPAK